MKSSRRALAALLVLGGMLAACKRTPARVKHESFELANGLAVELIHGACGDGAEIVVLYEVGSDHDPAERSGLTAVLAGALGLEAAADHMWSARAVERADVAGALDAIAAQMGGPGPAAADVERARAAAIAELGRRRGGDAALTAMSYAAESVAPSPGDGWRGGIAEQIAAITAAELESFRRAHLTAGNARLVVAGTFDPAELRARIEAAFGPQPAGSPPVARPPVAASVTGTLVMGSAPSVVALAVPAPAVSSPLYPAFLILAARLAAAGEPAVVFDPLAEPRILFVTAALAPGEAPEAAAARVRGELAPILARPLARGDVAAARDRFAAFLGTPGREPAECRRDRRGVARGRARRGQLGRDAAALERALAATSAAQLAEAAALFDARRTAAVIAGGPIR